MDAYDPPKSTEGVSMCHFEFAVQQAVCTCHRPTIRLELSTKNHGIWTRTFLCSSHRPTRRAPWQLRSKQTSTTSSAVVRNPCCALLAKPNSKVLSTNA